MHARTETLKKRQEKEFKRLVEGESKMVALQQKLQKAQEEELRRKREHDKMVQEHRKAEIEKKKQRSVRPSVSALCACIFYAPTTIDKT